MIFYNHLLIIINNRSWAKTYSYHIIKYFVLYQYIKMKTKKNFYAVYIVFQFYLCLWLLM